MFKIFVNGVEVPGVADIEMAKVVATMMHADFDAEVAVVDIETGEIILAVIDHGDCWEIYEAEEEPDVIEVEFIIIEM